VFSHRLVEGGEWLDLGVVTRERQGANVSTFSRPQGHLGLDTYLTSGRAPSPTSACLSTDVAGERAILRRRFRRVQARRVGFVLGRRVHEDGDFYDLAAAPETGRWWVGRCRPSAMGHEAAGCFGQAFRFEPTGHPLRADGAFVRRYASGRSWGRKRIATELTVNNRLPVRDRKVVYSKPFMDRPRPHGARRAGGVPSRVMPNRSR